MAAGRVFSELVNSFASDAFILHKNDMLLLSNFELILWLLGYDYILFNLLAVLTYFHSDTHASKADDSDLQKTVLRNQTAN